MAIQNRKPVDIVDRVARRREARAGVVRDDPWRRETFCLPRSEAREKAREWFERFPKAAYMTEIEILARTRRRPDRIRHAPPADRGLRPKPARTRRAGAGALAFTAAFPVRCNHIKGLRSVLPRNCSPPSLDSVWRI